MEGTQTLLTEKAQFASLRCLSEQAMVAKMSFPTGPIQFTRDVATAVNSIRRSVLGQSLPRRCTITPALTKYSRLASQAPLGYVRRRLSRQEIDHGVEIVEEEVRRKVKSGIAEVSRKVLELLPGALLDCKSWTFVSCFCAKRDSVFHRRKYGDYCLEFDTR